MSLNNIEKLCKKINAGDPVIGSSTTFLDSCITEFLSDVGYDFIWIDMEHTCLDKEHVKNHIMATRGTGSAAFVRVPWNDPVIVKAILEMGPDGIIFPWIKTAKEAQKAVEACAYPPMGNRGFGPKRANKYGLMNTGEYLKNAYFQFWTIIQIEHIEAVNNLEQILKVEGIDAITVGPNDLSSSIGLLGQTDHEEVNKLMDIIGETAKRFDKPIIAPTGNSTKKVEEWIKRGAEIIRVGTDLSLLRRAACEVFVDAKNIFEEVKA